MLNQRTMGQSHPYYTLEEFEEIINYKKQENGIITSPLLENGWDCFSFNKLSIFDDKTRGTISADIKKIEQIISSKDGEIPEGVSKAEDGAIGSMVGMAIGDAMGHIFEFDHVYYGKPVLFDMGEGPNGTFELQPGQWTDDASMGLCLADSLLVKGRHLDCHDLMHRFIAWWEGGYNNAFRYDKRLRHSVGLGGNISLSLSRYKDERYREEQTGAGDENTSGNGSLMRNAAVPCAFPDKKDIREACDTARKQSRVTHQGKEAAECCALLTFIVVKLLNGEELKPLLNSLGETFKTDVESVQKLANSEKEDEDRDWNWKQEKYEYSKGRAARNPGYIGSYAMDNLSMALHCVYTTETFKDAIIKVVNFRGDSDSVGSVVGQIAGAYYGFKNVPRDWYNKVHQWDQGEIPLRAYMLVHLKDKKSSVHSIKENVNDN